MTRTRLLVAALLAICLTTAWALAQQNDQPKPQPKRDAPAAAAVKAMRNIEYARVGDLPLRLDLYLPAKSDAKPSLIVWIHGGGWRQGSKDHCPLVWLTRHGYAVASVQYRLTDKAIFPAQIHDCKGAIRWLRAHADKYGYNAKRVGVAGISAGGHLVALLGTSAGVKEVEGDVGGNVDRSSRVQAVLDMCGPTDLIKLAGRRPGNANSAITALLGGPVSEKQDLAKLASPATHVSKDDAPLLIFQGGKDPLVDPNQAVYIRDLYKKAGLEATLDVVPDGGHVPRQFFDDKHKAMALKFFNKHIRQLK